MAYGEEVHDQLREQYQAALIGPDYLAEVPEQLAAAGEDKPTFTEEQITYAAKHAYDWNGCMVCSECWHHTLPVEAYQTCPVKLLGNRTLEPGRIPFQLLALVMDAQEEEIRRKVVHDWLMAVWDQWVNLWNTLLDKAARPAIAVWRGLLLRAAWRDAGQE